MKKYIVKYKKLFLLIIAILLLFCVQTIAYSAINGTMTLKGDAYARVETDVRITDFRLASTNNATSSYEEFGKNHLITEVNLTNSSSSIKYYVEITNYGSTDVGIFDITGLPSGVNYSIKDYNLHDKICDDSGKCNSFIKKTYELTLTSTSSYTGNVQLNFDFRIFHKVTYTDIENKNYPVDVIDGGNLIISFQEDLKRVQILSNNVELGYYKTISNGSSINISNILGDVEVKLKPYVAKLVKGDINETGSEVCIGEECFYIISNNGTTVKMLSKYNLYIGNIVNRDNSMTTIQNSTGAQNSTALGYDFYSFPAVATLQYSSSNYWNNNGLSYPSYVYNENSNLYSHIESYKSYLISLGVKDIETRLITYEELKTLGCDMSKYTCDSAPEWVSSTSYWSGSAYDEVSVYVVLRYVKQLNNYLPTYTQYFGIRPVIEISVDEIKQLVRIISGTGSNVGDEICLADECFYTISSDTDNITMLAKYNLLVGNRYDKTNLALPLENPTGIQDEKAIGWFDKYNENDPITGSIPFASTNYWTGTISSFPSFVYSAKSTIYQHNENYKNYIKDFGIPVNEVRLIKMTELENLGCSSINKECKSAPSWIYSTTYWTGEAYNNSYLWNIDRAAFLDTDGYFSNANMFGIRPVIEIPKWLFANTIEVIINNKTYSAKEGMTWGEWVNSSYNKLNYYSDDTHICESDTIWLAYTKNGGIVNIASKVDPNETYYTYDFSVYWET